MSAVLSWLQALPWILGLALLAWMVCTARRNVGLVDIFWPLFLLVATLCYLRDASAHPPFPTAGPTPRALLVLSLVGFWSMRLAAHLALRNWNAPEDHRYQAIRARNQPGFQWKSLYLVFALQAVLAFIVSLPLQAAIASPAPLNPVDALGVALAVTGILVEALADWQLAAFRNDASNRGKVLDRGLWRYSRHPNYFGEFCVWWGFFFMALGTGAWWSIASPLLMSLLLLRVSGVTLLEKDIGQRRPAYAAYVARTSAFFPRPGRSP